MIVGFRLRPRSAAVVLVTTCGSRSHALTQDHVLIDPLSLVLPQLPLGAPKLLCHLLESGIEGEVYVVVLGLGAHHPERPHLDVDTASVARSLSAEVR